MRKTRGFSLAEVLIATSITAVAFLAIVSMFPTSYTNVRQAGEKTTALALAQQRIEWLRNQPFTAAALAAGTTTETLTGNYAGYTRTTTTQDNTPVSNVKQVTVTVTGSSGRTVSLVSLIGQ